MTGQVELDHVSKLYGSYPAVDDVSLEIRQGSFVSLLGPSGAGKSTVLRIIGGFELPDSGKVRIAGRDVTPHPPYRRDVNTVFQNYALFPHMNAAENVAYGLRQESVAPRERRKRVREALEMVQMLHFADRWPSQLSGGQQQRIALARALVKRPSVLLLDEPLGALDRKLRQQMQFELKLLQTQLGLTFIFVTHDQEEALAMSDFIAVMKDGQVEQFGSPAELYDTPQSAFVAGFIGAQNFLSGRRSSNSLELVSEDGKQFVAGRASRTLAPAGAALGAVRPENVNLSIAEPMSTPNKLHARIAAVIMLGDTLEYLLHLHNGQEFVSRLRRRDAAAVPLAGNEIWASWDPSNFALFPVSELSNRRKS